MSGLRGEMQQYAYGTAGAMPRAQLQHLAEQNERSDHGRGFKIDGHASLHVAKRYREILREERCGHAVEVSCAGAEADERKHVGAAMGYRGPETLEKGPTAPHDK